LTVALDSPREGQSRKRTKKKKTKAEIFLEFLAVVLTYFDIIADSFSPKMAMLDNEIFLV
jgi:hypothetical protein